MKPDEHYGLGPPPFPVPPPHEEVWVPPGYGMQYAQKAVPEPAGLLLVVMLLVLGLCIWENRRRIR